MSDSEASVAPTDVQESATRETGVRSNAPSAFTTLKALNQYIRSAKPRELAGSLLGNEPESDQLSSARRFKLAWGRGLLDDQLTLAASRKPANAGPLNSHALVLQSLALMQQLSPDYLRRLLVHVESLQWLEQASDTYCREEQGASKTKKAKGGRRKKSA